uniref:Ras-related protein Rab-18 n=1 Tax=Panagrellus redivivus TaxID=6233 RepID=A0A7E4V3H9_PANRE
MDYTDLLKTIIIGDSNVGKTWLLTDFLGGNVNSTKTTIGVEFHAKTMQIDGRPVKMQLWDTAGQDKYRVIVKQFYRNAVAIALVYDITNYTSFLNLDSWLEEAAQYIENSYVVMLIGNKADLTGARQVPRKEAEGFARLKGFLFMETSAKEATNVNAAFESLALQAFRASKREKMIKKADNDLVMLKASVEAEEAAKRKWCRWF